MVEDSSEGVVEDSAVVDARADNDLALDRNVVIEKCSEPPQAHSATWVLQHCTTDVGIGCMNTDVEWREPLGHYPLKIGFGEARQRRKISVEK